MEDRFAGVLTLAGGEGLQSELLIDDETLTIISDGREIGAWPLRYCRLSRRGGDEFVIDIDGEPATFAPLDPGRFALVGARRFVASPLADRIDVIRDVPVELTGRSEDTTSQSFRASRWWALIVLAAAVAVSLSLVLRSGEPAQVGDTRSEATTTTTSGEADGIFDQPLVGFVQRWNQTASEFGAPLLIRGVTPVRSIEATLSPRLVLQATADEEGNLEAVVMTADPAGDGEADRLVIAAWGIGIALASPDLDEQGRRQVLAELGLDVRDPHLDGLDGETDVAGVRYTLRYLDAFQRVLFSISPADR